jgi:acetyl esterase/lipase
MLAAALLGAALGLRAAAAPAEAQQRNAPPAPESAQEATVHVSAFDLPPSGFLGAETRAVLQRQKQEFEELTKICPYHPPESVEDVVAQRRCAEKHYYPAIIARYRERYKVAIEPKAIAGVATEIITPASGVSAANRRRVLINLHGGSFMYGGRWGGEVESIPIAALGRIKIVSVDYRMAPEYRFPVASEDVAAVYKALLADYKPANIGIYGCSAGGFLTAETVAWLLKEGLPAPGAIGMLCAAALPSGGGDSEHLGAAIAGARSVTSSESSRKLSYFRDDDLKDPLAFPGIAPHVLARFPDSLLITSTRDFLMSSVVATHAQLVRLGVKADLHVWEGLDHAFFFEPDLPESREVYDVIVRFFGAHLGGK